jgi:hypothetical protein
LQGIVATDLQMFESGAIRQDIFSIIWQTNKEVPAALYISCFAIGLPIPPEILFSIINRNCSEGIEYSPGL